MYKIDLNSDIGESFGAYCMGDDEAVMDAVTSANVACGFHAGDPLVMKKTIKNCAAKGVAVGAHPGYPDLVGFGRRNMDPTSSELVADVIYQIGALQGLATAAGTRVRYVKPHGALYNTIASDERQADDVITALLAVERGATLLALAVCVWSGAAAGKRLRQGSTEFVDYVAAASAVLAFVAIAWTGMPVLLVSGCA